MALPLPTPARALLTSAALPLRSAYPELTWVSEDNFHITLAFLGEQGPLGLEAARAAVHHVTASPAIGLEFQELALFPSRGPWRVMVAEFVASRQLISLYTRFNEALAREAECRELAPLNEEWSPPGSRPGRPFRAHVTLARRGSGRGAAVDRLDPDLFDGADDLLRKGFGAGGWSLDSCVLYKSELGRGGSVYRDLDRVVLSRT